MSIINGTLIAQAFHFLIAFYIIKHFFFKPIWAHIQAEQTAQKSLIGVVQMYQQKIRDKEDEVAGIWQNARAHFVDTIPSSEPVMPASRISSVQMRAVSSADLVQEVQQLEEAIIQKVKHVR